MKVTIKTLVLIAMLFIGINNANAQEDFEEDTEDVPQAPINYYALPMIVAGIALGYSFIRKSTKEE